MDEESVDSKTSTETYNLKSRTFRIPSHSDSILEVLNSQRERGEYCDITVLVEHQRFTAHKCVLAASSPYFDSLLSSDNDGLYLRQVSVDSFRTILDFMYTSKLQLEPGKIQDILSAAKFLQVKGVVSICCRYLETQIKALAKNIQNNPEQNSSPAAVLSVESRVPENATIPMANYLSPIAGQNPNQPFLRRPPQFLPQNNYIGAPDVGRPAQHELANNYNFSPPAFRNDDASRYSTAFPKVPQPKEMFHSNPSNQYQINPYNDQRHNNFQQGLNFNDAKSDERIPRRPDHGNYPDRRNHNYDPSRRHQVNADGRLSHWNPNFGISGPHNVSSPKPHSKSADMWDRKRGERNLLLSQPTLSNLGRKENKQFPQISLTDNAKSVRQAFRTNDDEFACPSLINSPIPRYHSNNHGRASASKKFYIEQSHSPGGFATISY